MGTEFFTNRDQPPYYDHGVGIMTPWGLLLSPQARIAAIVSSGGVQDYDPMELQDKMVPTLADGLKRARSGMGDIVLVRGNHAESVSAAGGLTNLVPGTKIIGLQDPTTGLGPTFTWTDDVTWAVDDANVAFQGLDFQMNGADDITTGITVTAINCHILDCNFNTGTGASLDCDIAVSASAAADGLVFARNKSRQSGGTTSNVLAIGATDDVLVRDNDLQIIGAAAGDGVIAVTGAATNLRILRNLLCQYHASSTTAILLSDAASTGVIADNDCAILDNGVAAATGVNLGASSLVRCFRNECCDEPIKSGVLSPVVCAS